MFGFWNFDHDVPHFTFVFILLGIPLSSRIFELQFWIEFGKLSAGIPSRSFLSYFLSLSPVFWDICYTCVGWIETVPHITEALIFFSQYFLPLCFSLLHFHWFICKFTNSVFFNIYVLLIPSIEFFIPSHDFFLNLLILNCFFDLDNLKKCTKKFHVHFISFSQWDHVIWL